MHAENLEKESPVTNKKARLYGLAVLIFTCFIFLFRLGSGSLSDYDESITALRIMQMELNKEYLTVHDNFAPSFRKPPLYYWMSLPAVKLVGMQELSMRVVSAIAGILCVFATAGICNLICKGGWGLLGGFFLATNWFFVSNGRQALLDSSMILFGLAVIYCCLEFLSDKGSSRWLLLAFVFAGLGALTKGPIALLASVPVLCVVTVIGRKRKRISALELAVCVALLLIIILPWHLHQFSAHGDEFLLEYFNIRISSTFPVFVGGTFYHAYIKETFVFGPVVILLALSGIFISLWKVRNGGPSHLVLITATFAVLLILVFLSNRRSVYMLPLAPILSVYAAYFVDWCSSVELRRLRPILFILCIVHLSMFLFHARGKFVRDENHAKKELALTAKARFKDDAELIVASNRVHIPALIYYSQIKTRHIHEAAELDRLLEEYRELPVVLHDEDEASFEHMFSRSRLIERRDPYSLRIIHKEERTR
jgi:4-amino-4-deoxy-L-arabinose transferase-like glycosyltransferase